MAKRHVVVRKEKKLVYEVASSPGVVLTDAQAIQTVTARMHANSPFGLLHEEEKIMRFEVTDADADADADANAGADEA